MATLLCHTKNNFRDGGGGWEFGLGDMVMEQQKVVRGSWFWGIHERVHSVHGGVESEQASRYSLLTSLLKELMPLGIPM